jgi:Aspartyl protease
MTLVQEHEKAWPDAVGRHLQPGMAMIPRQTVADRFHGKVGLCACALLLATVAAAQNSKPDCRLEPLASTQIGVGEPVLIPIQYRGQSLWMALDLGSPFSLVWPSAVEPLHLHTQTLDTRPGEFLLAVEGQHVTTTVAVDSLAIGSYRISRRDFFVDPRSHSIEKAPAETVLGSLGMRELWPVDFELDLAHRRFNLYSPDRCPKAVANTWGRVSQIPLELNEFGNVLFPVELNGSKVVASISTTNADTTMSTDVSRQIFGFDERSPQVQLQMDAQGHSHGYFRSMALTSGDLQFPSLPVRLTPAHRDCTLASSGIFGDVAEFKGRGDHLCFGTYPLVLGRSAIEHMRLYFATRDKMLYFAPAD